MVTAHVDYVLAQQTAEFSQQLTDELQCEREGVITPDALERKLSPTWMLGVADPNLKKDKTSIINTGTAIVAKRKFELIDLHVCRSVDSHTSLNSCHRKTVQIYSDLDFKTLPTFTKMEVYNGTFPCFHFTYVTKDTVCCCSSISFSGGTYTYESSHCLFEPNVSLTLHKANKLSLKFTLKMNEGKNKNISFSLPRKHLLVPYISLLRMSQKLLYLSKQSHQQISVQQEIPYHSFLVLDTKYNIYKRRKRRQAVSHAKPSDNVKLIPEHIQGASSLKPPEHTQSKEKQRGRTSSYFNSTVYKAFIKEEILRRQRDRDAQWAYLCLVFIMCTMLWFIWYLRGFHSRNSKKKLITMHDNSHLLTVKEVLWRKSRYLPMFRRNDGLEEVFVHDCGNDP